MSFRIFVLSLNFVCKNFFLSKVTTLLRNVTLTYNNFKNNFPFLFTDTTSRRTKQLGQIFFLKKVFIKIEFYFYKENKNILYRTFLNGYFLNRVRGFLLEIFRRRLRLWMNCPEGCQASRRVRQ